MKSTSTKVEIKKMIPQNAKCTSKKVKYAGTEEWINRETGEVQEFEVTNIEERDFNFTKVFMQNFLLDLEALGNKKLKVAIYICENIDRDGYFIGTIDKICKDTGFSYKTVRLTISTLIEADFMKRISPGAYIINANHLFKGSDKHRMNVLKRYREVEAEN